MKMILSLLNNDDGDDHDGDDGDDDGWLRCLICFDHWNWLIIGIVKLRWIMMKWQRMVTMNVDDDCDDHGDDDFSTND